MVRTHGTDKTDQKLLDDVRQFGWHMIGIAEDAEGPDFVYSVGLHHTLGQPEIIIFGLSPDTGMRIINNIGEAMRKGTRFADACASDELIEGYSCVFRAFARDQYREYLGYALWFYEGADFPVLQCVWPDREHRYPWHGDFCADLRKQQPLFAEPSDRAG